MRHLGLILVALTAQAAPVVRVPFVGCRSGGQSGWLAPPHDAYKIVGIDAATAKRSAYYKAERSSGVLAPRGWHCFGTFGSSGSTLFVTPQPSDNGINGPGIEVDDVDGGTMGRYQVGRLIARVFPKRREFVRNIIASELGSASDFPLGPYPNDKLNYRGANIVEYATPPRSEGLGTISQFITNEEPIEGVAILKGETPDLLLLTLRLPPDLHALASHIIRQIERENAEDRSRK
jgi:hypothetical protein